MCLVQSVVAIYFLVQAHAYLKPIMLFLAQEEEERQRQSDAMATTDTTDPSDATLDQVAISSKQQRRRRTGGPTLTQQPLRAARTEYLVKWISLR